MDKPAILPAATRCFSRKFRVTVAASLAVLSALFTGGALGADAPAHAWPSTITGTGSDIGSTRTFAWTNSPYGNPGVSAIQTITSRVSTPSAAGCALMGGAGTASNLNSFSNVTTFIEPDFPARGLVANNCLEGGNGYTSSFVFSKPVIAPIFHVYNLDASRMAISGTSTTGAAIGLQTVVKNNLMDVSGTTLNNTLQPATQNGCNNNTGTDTTNGACGSLRLTAASGLIQSLSLNNNATPPTGTPTGFNDGFAWSVSFPTASLTKQFSPASINAGQTSQLIFSITNPNQSASVTLTPLDFTDNLPTGVTVASAITTNNGSCGAPTVTDGSGGTLTVGNTSIRASNISVAPGTTCTISVAVTATADGEYTNDASNMSTNVGNLIPGGSTTLTVPAPVDLAITKDDGAATFTRGSDLTYTIVASNSGPSDATGAQISDPLPAGITTASWTCGSATGGGVCGVANGTGPINATADLPAGSSVTFALEMTVPADYPGVTLTNTAVVTAPTGVTEADESNNTAADTNSLSPPQPSFGMCDSRMFLAQNRPTGLYQFQTSSNPITVQPVGSTSSYTYNAVAYNPSDNYLYAISASNNLLRIGSDGSVADLGTVTNLPQVVGQEYNAAEIAPDGSFYVRTNAVYNGLYRIDLATKTAAAIPLSQTLSVADLAWHNGLLYAVDNQNFTLTLYAIDPANGQVTSVGPTGLATSGFGALFGASNGLFGGLNAGGFYQFDLTTGAATLISDLPGSSNNDGAKCAMSPMEFPVDLEIEKDNGVTTYTPGLDTTYSIVVSNNGPFGVSGARVQDSLPAGVTTANWTCGSETGGAICGAPSGTGGIDTTASLPAGSSVTYELSLGVPASQTGNFTNTATVTPPAGSPDADMSNNTASDTDSELPPPTSGMCSPVRILGNTTFSTAPMPVTGTVTKSGAPNGWNPDSPWSTYGGNYTFTWTFAQPIPANWIEFAIGDVGADVYRTTPPRITIGVAGGSANAADFSLVPGWRSDAWGQMLWNPSTGVLSYDPSGELRQAGALRGNSTDTLTSITLTTSNIVSGDHVSNALYVRPSCLTVSKVSEDGTGSFQIDMTNVVEADGAVVPSTTLTTTTAGTSVSSPAYNAVPGRELILSEVVPAGWDAESAICTDQNAGVTGNPTVIGAFSSPAISIPAANVRPQSDIQCRFTNVPGEPVVSVAKELVGESITVNDVAEPGEVLTYEVTITHESGAAFSDFEFIENIPNGATMTRVVGADGFTDPVAGASTVLLTVPEVPVGGEVVVTIDLTVAAPIPLGITEITNRISGGDVPEDCTDCSVRTPTPPYEPQSPETMSCSTSGSYFNTAFDGAGGMKTSGFDNYWQVALTPTPVSGPPPSGLTWGGASVVSNPPAVYMTSPFGNANWISNSSTATHPTAVNYDIFYRYQFNLDSAVDPTSLDLDMTFYSDNAVYEVWVNGVAQGVRSNYGASDPYFYAGFNAAGGADGSLSGAWRTGLNEIIVHIKSGPGAQAFMAQINTEAICQPKLTLRKQVINDDGGAASVADFVLRASGQAPLTEVIEGPMGASAVTNASVPAGTYALSEDNLSGYAPSLYSCAVDGGTATPLADNELTLANGQNAICTITNDDFVPEKALTGESGVIADVAEPGETLTYTLTLTNDGESPAVYDLVDNIDDNTSYVAGSTRGTAGAAEPSGTDPLSWSGTIVPAGSSVTVVYDVLVDDPLDPAVTEIRNAATEDCAVNPGACVTTPASGTAIPSKALTGESGTIDGLAEPGETLTFTVTLTNSDATQAVYDLVDNIDDNTTYVAGSATVDGIAREPVGSDPITWDDIIVPANGTIEVIYDVLVADPLDSSVTEIRNAATEDCGANPGACVTVPTAEQADLAITKTNGSDTYVPGANLDYTIVVSNNGPADVVGALVNDPLPSGYSSATWSCSAATGGASCSTPSGSGAIVDVPVDLPSGSSVTFTLSLPIAADTTGEIINPATVTAPPATFDTDLSNNTARDRDVYPLVDINKTLFAEDGDIEDVAEPGETLTYRLAIENREPFEVTYDPFDNLDDNTSYVANSSTINGAPREPDVVGDPLIWQGVTIGIGATVIIEYEVTVADPLDPSVTQIRNAATEDCAAYPQACVTTPTPGAITPTKDLTAESGAIDGVAEPGETLTYTVTLTNGGAGANLYDLVDDIDDNTSYVTGTARVDGVANEPSGTDPLTWDAILVPAGGSIDVVYQVAVADPIPDGVTEIRNAATDNCAANPDACVTTPTPGPITPSKDLTAESGAIDGVAEPGETLTYTVTLSNGGAGATLYELVDNIDDNTSYVAGSASVDGVATEPSGADPLIWDAILVPAGGAIDVVYEVTVADPIPDGVTAIRNAATDDCATYPDACVTTPTPGAAVPSKALTDESGLVDDVAEPGETLTYTVTLTNASGSAALYDLVDNIDDNTSYVAGSAQVGGVAREPVGTDPLNWDDIVVPAGGTVAVVYQVIVADPIPDGVTEIHNAATDDCATYPDACVTTPTPGAAVPSKALTGEDGLVADVAEPGETLTYTVTLTNASGTAALYDLVDNIDDNTAYVAGSARVDGVAREPVGTDPLNWDDLVVPAGGTVEVVYQVVVADPIPDGVSEIRNAATDDCSVYPDACVTTPALGSAVPSKALTAESGIVTEVAEPGETLTYTVTLTNSGSAAALYDLVDDIDANTSYVAGSASVDGVAREPDVAGDPLEWADILVPAGGTAEIVYQVTVVDPIPAGVTQIGNIAYRRGTPPPDCETTPTPGGCVIVPVPGSVVPLKALTDESGIVDDVAEPGETLTYRVTLTNEGAGAAAYDLADNIDDHTTYVAGSATVDGSDREPDTIGDPLIWNEIIVPAGGSVEVLYQVVVDDPLDPGVTELRNIAYDGRKPEPSCEDVPDQCVVLDAPAPELELEKAGAFEDANGNGVADPGETIRYTFTVTNTGNVPLADVAPVDGGPTFNDEPAQEVLSAFDPVGATIEPGEEQVFTATYPLTQIDIDNGAGVEDGVENTATATGYAFGTRITGLPVESAESTVAVALPAAPSEITVIKIADIRVIRRGEQAAYTIRVTNAASTPARGMTVTDTLPSGFRFVEGSAMIGNVAVTPTVQGRQVIFENVEVPANGEIEIRLRTLALSSAGPGEHVNRAGVTDSTGRQLAPEATATVEIVAEPVFDCSEIIGRVFDDRNRNGYQDEGEPGLPGVRLATVNGELITTDAHGRFSVPCAALPDQRIGSNFILKLDIRTLPTGYRLTTENPRVVRLTAGKMTELNFGASIGRVVRLDLQDGAFEPGLVDLRPEWEGGIDDLIGFLAQEQSVLRLTYIEAGADPDLAQDRLESLQALIAERWRATSGQYRLEIEMRVETGQ
ncbi:DUF6923 family protein [Pelagibacterium sp. H642]|uniref:DUF7927 domain-containing protein n=1 Tax=Pelagibacterium sp. H642 TaxID=1881069 RepID=UPI0028159AA5|nr:hypothetical protein [Pelagibacterium sp. H642]WMT92583.1 hypothetical protein NO934_19750 [Pelagibacterium sp. H642]